MYIYIYIYTLTQSPRTGTKATRKKHIVQPTGLGARSSTCRQWDGEEKNNYCNKLIIKPNVDENVITDPMTTLEEGRTFYSKRYSDKNNHISTHLREEISDIFTI